MSRMKIDFPELDANKSKEFLDYFNAALRSRHDMPFAAEGSASAKSDGFESSFWDFIKVPEEGGAAITWKIAQKMDGRLVSIEATPDSEQPPDGWKDTARSFVTDILTSVLSGRKQKFFRRRRFSALYHENLKGEYWISGYRFAPLLPDDDSTLMNAERLLVIDQELDAIDNEHADEIADERAAILSAQLSIITDICIFKPADEYRYIITRKNGEFINDRAITKYLEKESISSMPSKGDLCDPVNFEGSVFDSDKSIHTPFSLPRETRRIIKCLELSNPQLKLAFNKASLVFQLALSAGRYYPTVKIAYEYASIDALNQALGSPYRGFSDFVRNNLDDNEYDEEILDYIHGKVRSAHWHGGEFALGETDYRRDFLTNPQELIRFHILRDAHRIIRKSMFNWVMREVVK